MRELLGRQDAAERQETLHAALVASGLGVKHFQPVLLALSVGQVRGALWAFTEPPHDRKIIELATRAELALLGQAEVPAGHHFGGCRWLGGYHRVA
jgi:hypothetical protein